MQILNFTHSTVLCAFTMMKWTLCNRQQQRFWLECGLTKHFGQRWPFLRVAILASKKSCLVQRHLQVWLAFHQFQLIVLIRAGELKEGKENDVQWDKSKSYSASETLLQLTSSKLASNPRSDLETARAKKPFFSMSHLKRWLLSL